MSGKVATGARVTKLGRYEVLNELGKGAMGVVYLAKDPVIGRLVAIKTIRISETGDDDSEAREFRERFVREAQTAGILSHPNIVTIHDIGEDSETRTAFIAMEYIEGRNLKSLLADKAKFGWDQIADLIAQIAEALDYAHRKGIIHRDVKPANIILTTDSKVKITDFGIAKVASSNLTTTGQFLGTPNYMSPEQVSGAPVDGRSDIFSLGVVLYELLTSRKPFQGDNLTAISYKIVHEDFTPPAELSNEVPQEFNAIVEHALAKDPWNRYQRGKDMALALHQIKAHLEEQRALQDLGTMVSAAENLPTLKLANVERVAARGAPRDTEVLPPTATVSPDPPRTRPAPERYAGQYEAPMAEALPEADPEGFVSSFAPGPSLEEDLSGLLSAAVPTVEPPPPQAPRDWKAVARAEVEPKWFWIVTAAAMALFVLVVGYFALRARALSTPAVEPDAAMEREVLERRQALEEAKRLFASGKYEESLAEARKVLARSPNNDEARNYAQMAETALKGRQEEAQRFRHAAELVGAAKAALAEGKSEEARKSAQEALALDAGNSEASSIRDEAERKIAADAAARKKGAKPRQVQAPKNAKRKETAPATSTSGRGTVAAPAPAAAGTATLRLAFEAPIPEGHVMVAVNDQILLRKPFAFKKHESRGVSASVSVPSGQAAIKVWLSGPDMASAFATTTAQFAGGETRTLRLDYAGGSLAARLQ